MVEVGSFAWLMSLLRAQRLVELTEELLQLVAERTVTMMVSWLTTRMRVVRNQHSDHWTLHSLSAQSKAILIRLQQQWLGPLDDALVRQQTALTSDRDCLPSSAPTMWDTAFLALDT